MRLLLKIWQTKYLIQLDGEILKLTKKFDKDCESQMNKYLKKFDLEENCLNNILLVKAKGYSFKKNIIQY